MSGSRTRRGDRSLTDSRDALGLAPTGTGVDPAGQPPRLRTGLWSGLKLLLLMNVVPLIGLGWLAWAAAHGQVSFRELGHVHKGLIAAVLLGCVVVVVTAWLVMPVARWLRAYPAWHFRHRSRALWLLPTIGGFVAWLALWAVCAAALLVVAWLVGGGLYALAHR